MHKGLLVIDGDWLAFLVACAIEKTSVKIYDSENVFVKEYKNKTLYKKDVKNYNETNIIQDCQTLPSNYISASTFILTSKVKKLLIATQCNEVLIALGGDTNFRDRLHLPRKYKGSREFAARPLALSEVKNLIASKYKTEYSNDEEADDIISKYQFLSYQKVQENNGDVFKDRIVVCTLDKDARSTPGILHDPKTNETTFINGLGYVTRKLTASKKSKLYGVGRKWFYAQLLTGDKADDYFPCDLRRKLTNNESKSPLITDLKCFNLLDPCTTDDECLKVIKDTYYDWYKDVKEWVDFNGNTVKGDWLDILQMYVDVVHMRRFDNDRVDVKKLLTTFKLI